MGSPVVRSAMRLRPHFSDHILPDFRCQPVVSDMFDGMGFGERRPRSGGTRRVVGLPTALRLSPLPSADRVSGHWRDCLWGRRPSGGFRRGERFFEDCRRSEVSYEKLKVPAILSDILYQALEISS